MRIDDSFAASNDVRSTELGRSQEIQQQEQQARQSRSESESDSASLSALGANLARALTSDPPDVVARVEQLEQAVQSGTFEASSSEVAESVIDAALQAQSEDDGSLSPLSFESSA